MRRLGIPGQWRLVTAAEGQYPDLLAGEARLGLAAKSFAFFGEMLRRICHLVEDEVQLVRLDTVRALDLDGRRRLL